MSEKVDFVISNSLSWPRSLSDVFHARKGTNSEVKEHVTSTYGVTFDLFSKIRVNGGRAHPLWKFLTKKGGAILWNFTKFLIDKDGVVIKR